MSKFQAKLDLYLLNDLPGSYECRGRTGCNLAKWCFTDNCVCMCITLLFDWLLNFIHFLRHSKWLKTFLTCLVCVMQWTLNTMVSQKFFIFWYVLIYSMYIIWLKQFKSWNVLAVFSRILVIGVLKCCTLLHSMCELKATLLNVRHSLIQEFTFYKFELSHNTVKAIKKGRSKK